MDFVRDDSVTENNFRFDNNINLLAGVQSYVVD